MKQYTINIFIFISLFMSACQNKISNKDCIGIDVNNDNFTPKFSDLFSQIEILPLETNDSCLIAKGDKIIYDHNNIYILDKKQSLIFIFNNSGQFLWKLNKQGRGPGEYSDIEDFVINPTTGNIEILSVIGQYMIYNPQGSHMQSYQIPVHAIHYLYPINDDITAFYDAINDGSLMFFSKKENKIIAEKQMTESYILQKTPYKPIVTPFSYYDGKVFFLVADRKKIYNISTSVPEIKEYQCFNYGNLDHDIRDLPTDQEISFYLNENQKSTKIYGVSHFRETKERMIVYSVYNEFWHTTFYDKTNHKTMTLNKPSRIMIYYPFECTSEFIASLIPVSIIERQVKKEWVNEEEWEKIKSIPMEANPIILKYHFK